MLKIFLMVLSFFSLAGCASNSTIVLNESGALNKGKGVIVTSIGRSKGGGFLPIPFVSYGIYHKDKSISEEKVAFLPAEAGLINQLGKGKYGFIHIHELDAGDYYLIGQKGRGNAAAFGLIGAVMHFDSNGKETGMAMEFSVKDGVVTYLGEILTINKNLNSDAIAITDQSSRDYRIAIKQSPKLNNVKFEKNIATKL